MTDLELYNQAKEAYYNGSPIMEDFEFDELEKRLGLENKSYIGAKHNPAYTEKHPYIMGSLSKVQIKKEEDGSVDWEKYLQEVRKYTTRYALAPELIITPKFDGCSFEVYVKDGRIASISTRGDGEYGKSIYPHIIGKCRDFKLSGECTLRGEVLIGKSVFEQKYSDFVNPRSFVSGVLNRDFDPADEEMAALIEDLSIIIYDYRVNDGGWQDRDWSTCKAVPADMLPQFYLEGASLDSAEELRDLYAKFADYREKCPYALDGIVIKPMMAERDNNLTEARPKDCIAVKFIPMLEETEVVSIEWSTKKTNELRPVVIVKPVEMDGKQVSRASAHNYGFLMDNGISVGTKVVLSLAGDIIPFIYKITDTSAFDESKLCLPEGLDTYIDGCHLYRTLSAEDRKYLKFLASAEALSIPQIGPSSARTIFDYLGEMAPDNLLLVSPADVQDALQGKLGENALKSMDDFLGGITLKDIIISCAFESCGPKAAEQIEKYLLLGEEAADFSGLAEKAYGWALDPESEENAHVAEIVSFIGRTFGGFREAFRATQAATGDQIPVILTGEPNEYSTKAEFLKAHPEYRVTGSWKEVKIVFTDSLDSTSSKMKKAKDKGIEIRLY